MAVISKLSVSLMANTKGLETGLNRARRQVKSFSKSVFNAKTILAGALGGIGVKSLISGLISTNKEIQTLKSSLKSVTGSAENANNAFLQIQSFAKTTPYDLEQVTRGFIQLKALGLDPSRKAMRSYGNTASAMGKDMNQMIEAVADAVTGEFERLKEFGIKAKKQGDDVSFTFQGVTKTIKNSSKEITGYLQDIGNNQFGTAMSDQMNNLAPAFSNMSQSFSDLSVRIGEAGFNDTIMGLTKSVTAFVDSFDTKKLKEIEITIGGIGAGLKALGGYIPDDIASYTLPTALYKANAIENNGIAPNRNGKYQLGDFNNSSSQAPLVKQRQRYNDLKASLEEKYSPQNIDALKQSFTKNETGKKENNETKETNQLLKTSNEILKNMSGILQGKLGYAVAG